MGDEKRILVVDDEAVNREVLDAFLTAMGHQVALAADGFDALARLNEDFDLVLLDVMLPTMNGFEIAQRIRKGNMCPDIPICMVTALSSQEDRLRAVEAGANDFIAKPVDKTELKVRTASLLKAKEAQDALKRHQAELEDMVSKRTTSLQQAMQDMAKAERRTHQAHLETIERLALAAEYKDEDTANHIKRMSRFCRLIACKLDLHAQECETIYNASTMHDVGKIGIPDHVLLKPGPLEESEWKIMKTHTGIGARILSGSTSDMLQAGETIAVSHHEKWDGSGYPQGLAGEDIPLWGRIAAVADVFDALTSRRPYKAPFPTDKALEILREGRGTHFDPYVLDIFFDNLDEVYAIQEKYQDQNTPAKAGFSVM